MSDTENPAPDEWEGLLEVCRFPDAASAHEYALVVLAMNLACCVVPVEGTDEFSLFVEPSMQERILREFDTYDKEQAAAQPAPARTGSLFDHPPGWDAVGLWIFFLLMVFFWQNKYPAITGKCASSSVGLFRDGQWWRPFTALFLHADGLHLLGNILSGTLFGTLVSRLMGPWRGGFLILASGAIGNILTCALTYPDHFTSIGASTAVFGALGILSGLGVSSMLENGLHLPLAKTTAPFLAGLVLLGWLGSGQQGENTDVLGHVMGFSSGLLIGLANKYFHKSSRNNGIAETPVPTADGNHG